jgi:hypothetical protein
MRVLTEEEYIYVRNGSATLYLGDQSFVLTEAD